MSEKSLQEIYPHFEIGRGSYGGLRIFDWKDGTTVKVGSYCSFAFGVNVLLGGEHRIEWVTTYPFTAFRPELNMEGHPKSKGDISIGSDVWVGAEAMILSGVNIGHGAVIGARSVVTHNIPPYAIAVGYPAKIIGYRFGNVEIAGLLHIAWWEWPEERITRALPFLCAADIWGFITRVNRGEL